MGALRGPWADRYPARARLAAWGKQMSPHCSACESKHGSVGHTWCDCPAFMQPDKSELLIGAA
eukprot:6415333-Pyramimonas_sp.AAC.1